MARLAARGKRLSGDQGSLQPDRHLVQHQPAADFRLRSRQRSVRRPCAKQIAENLAHRAYRRPVTADDISRLMNFYNEGRLDKGTFDQGITEVVAAVLASPDFLFRSIPTPKGVSKNSEFPLTDLELASRLSFFIWNTGPDAELLKLAETHQLSKPGALDAQVKRMMADPRPKSLVTSFAMKWLNLNSLDSGAARPEDFQWLQCHPPQGFHDGSREVPGQRPAAEQECRGVADLRSAPL